MRPKDEYPEGTRVRFVRFGEPDPYTQLQPGAEGTVRFVDDTGTVHVDWNDGSTLGMIVEGTEQGPNPAVPPFGWDTIEKL